MERITKFRYSVVKGEKIKIKITPVKIGPRVVAQQNRVKLPNVGSKTTPKFEFKVDQVPGNTHFLILDFTFTAGDDPDASFQIDIASSGGGSFEGVKRVGADTANKSPVFRFEVADDE